MHGIVSYGKHTELSIQCISTISRSLASTVIMITESQKYNDAFGFMPEVEIL